MFRQSQYFGTNNIHFCEKMAFENTNILPAHNELNQSGRVGFKWSCRI